MNYFFIFNVLLQNSWYLNIFTVLHDFSKITNKKVQVCCFFFEKVVERPLKCDITQPPFHLRWMCPPPLEGSCNWKTTYKMSSLTISLTCFGFFQIFYRGWNINDGTFSNWHPVLSYPVLIDVVILWDC